MNSKWQANKIGLLNFWYYDEQEFSFYKGRMLLRGSNGSGKSVTMQSVVPLLLDGNMSPERLDPFGSRDRKMNSYLLEENDGREERTGYLYIEFKRKESDTYITFGIGIRARRGKPLDKWYFAITDGRRVGKDFFLYKETSEKIPLSKKELQNRIMSGGHVFDRQQEYMEYVNQKVFGFETVEEYKELIDLLIQLRTPKLSKDFKPSVINEILCDSLQPLSDDELRPMSEAIENMDNMTMNLKARVEAKNGADKINRVYDKYNKIVLLERAKDLNKTIEELDKLNLYKKDKEKEIDNNKSRIEELKEHKSLLESTRQTMEKEREELNKSDAVGLKEQENEVIQEVNSLSKTLEEKKESAGRKENQYIDEKNRLKDDEDKEYEKSKEIEELLNDMSEDAQEMSFDEHDFFIDEFEKNKEDFNGFEHHEKELDRTKTGIKNCYDILKEMDVLVRRKEDRINERDHLLQEMNVIERQALQTKGVVTQKKNEWIEALYKWNNENSILKLEKDKLSEFTSFVENYNIQSDFNEVLQSVFNEASNKRRAFDEELVKITTKKADTKDEYDKWQTELKEWENQKEPVPPRDEDVIRNRERLTKAGIPFNEFYKVIEFDQSLTEEECNRLEEALYRMGILDALIIDEEYKDKVLAVEKGCADRYLFRGNTKSEKSLLDVLELNDQVNNIFFNQIINGMLESIGYDDNGLSCIYKDGTYRSGILSGTISGTYEAGYLGTKARENNRQKQIAICKDMLENLSREIEEYNAYIESLTNNINILEDEQKSFPKVTDIYEALKMYVVEKRKLDSVKSDIDRVEKFIKELIESIKEYNVRALEIAKHLYLDCNLEVLTKADNAAREYERKYNKLKSIYELYKNICESITERKERIENLEYDLDEVRYDISNVEKDLLSKKQLKESIRERLALTDYEEIRERLDYCLNWLKKYPGELEKIAHETSRKETQIENITLQLTSTNTNIDRLHAIKEKQQKLYDNERNLKLVDLLDYDKKLEDIIIYLSSKIGKGQKETTLNELNRIFFENKGFLNEYQPVITQDKDESSLGRVYINARYQGVEIPFNNLISYLENDIADLQNLIKDGDRELFEDILGNTISRKIRAKINMSSTWVDNMNKLMGAMNTSSGLKLSLKWRSKNADEEDQLDTKELVDLLKKDYRLMKEDEAEKLSKHFRSKVDIARRNAKDSGGSLSFYQVMKDTLDYRKWFEFLLFYEKTGERQKELTNSAFGTFSGGEKAMSMYVPLFSAVVAKYDGGGKDAPKIISLDEAFAGVDNRNIRDMFRLMSEFDFDFIINSQVLWGDCDTLDALAIYQLIRPENAKFVTVMSYLWNGHSKEMMEDERQLEETVEAVG